ncbi:MAG: maleylpyruvate isomerase N-terminal domain-containing protein, partial [Acidimicrobiales bacterium]
GSPEVTARQVNERTGRSAEELAKELADARAVAAQLLPAFDDEAWAAPSPGGYEGTLGDGIEALWYDAYLHADDIRDALGQPPVRSNSMRAAVSHVAFELGKRGWGPATIALEGMPAFDVGGGGQNISGDPLSFVLAATGRGDPEPLGLDRSVNIYAG